MKTYLQYFLSLFMLTAVAHAAAPVPALYVEVLVYSGRPNPTFLITDPQEIAELTSLAKGMPAGDDAAKDAPSARRLGYRGFSIENVSMTNADLASFTVFRSAVEVNRIDGRYLAQKSVRKDADSRLEQKLIKALESRGLVSAEVLKHIKG